MLATAVGMLKVEPVVLELEEVFRAENASVLRAAFRITGSLADAEDVAQSIFLRLARGGLDSARIESVGSYLRRAAVNAALDLLRSRQLRGQVPIEQAASVLSSSQPSPERTRASAELRQRFRSALSKLHPRAAEMFALRYLEGFDNREIARAMRTSQAVVAVTLHRARSRLRKELSEFSRSGS